MNLGIGEDFRYNMKGTVHERKKWKDELYFFFNFILFLNLKHCISFAKHQNESATGIHVLPILNPPPSPHHPSRSSQCTSLKHPVSCIEPRLATRFIHDITHVSMPFSQIFPPSPSPTESIRLIYTQSLFCCLVHRVIVNIFLNSIYMH